MSSSIYTRGSLEQQRVVDTAEGFTASPWQQNAIMALLDEINSLTLSTVKQMHRQTQRPRPQQTEHARQI